MRKYMNFSTAGSLLKARYFSYLEKYGSVGKSKLEEKLDGYTLIERIKDKTSDTFHVGLYKDNQGKKYIIKKINFNYKNLFYVLIWNEISMLSVFESIKKSVKSNLNFPSIKKVLETKNTVYLVREFIDGKVLSNYEPSKKIAVFDTVCQELEHLSQHIPKDIINKIPKRTPLQILLFFPIYFILALIKEPSQFLKFSQLLATFYISSISSIFTRPTYVLSHRDLTSENIFLTHNRIALLDCETFMLAEKETEIALFTRFYMNELSISDITTYLQKKLFTPQLKNNFIRLTIFYTFQFLSSEQKGATFYNEALDYSTLLKSVVLPQIKKEKVHFIEIINKIGLSFCGGISKLMNLKSSEPSILCYHSIDDFDWRFSMNKEIFESQMKYLHDQFTVLPLSEILKTKKKNCVAITFDDGYEDILITAAPILKKYNIPATVFIIGNPEKADRDELGNNLCLLDYEQIKQLIKEGLEIGFHTTTHRNLAKLKASDIEKEILTGKKNVEKNIDTKLRYFAYPRGYYSAEIINAVKKAGFEAAFTVDAGSMKNISMYKVSRISLEKDLTFNQFFALLTPIGRKFQELYMMLLKTKVQLSYKLKGAN